jgi:predicted secreted protein
MTTPFPFTSGQVLTAAQMNDITVLPINDQTDDYTLVAGDRGKRVIMNKATANTVTVDDAVFGVGDSVFIANKGAGVSTITAGAGVTINVSGSLALAQNGGGTLLALSASTFTFFPAGGVGSTH